jgi:hypothetical protein
MQDSRTLDLFGESVGHKMARLSAEKSDKFIGDWTSRAEYLLLEFVRFHNDPFLVEEVRAYAEDRGLPPPLDGRAWGHVIKAAHRNKYVQTCGFAAAKSSNGSPKVLWRKL